MYGVVSTGNQAETSIRLAAEHYKDTCPPGASSICDEIYVNVGLPNADTMEEMEEVMRQVTFILNCCGFYIKVWTCIFDSELSPAACSDGTSIGVVGLKWIPGTDELGLAWGEMNFHKSIRGKRRGNEVPVITGNDVLGVLPEVIRRIDCVSQTAQIYDIIGTLEPLKARFKLDLSDLVLQGLDWNDTIPPECVPIWTRNFQLMQDMRHLRYARCVVPLEVIEPRFRIIEAHDASKDMTFMGIWAGCLLRIGSYTCQLLFSRSIS